jgi:hypothetical protein
MNEMNVEIAVPVGFVLLVIILLVYSQIIGTHLVNCGGGNPGPFPFKKTHCLSLVHSDGQRFL